MDNSSEINSSDKITNFINNYDHTLTQICIKARSEHGIGVLVVDISDKSSDNNNECHTHYFPVNDIPEHLIGYKERLLTNPQRDRTIYYVVSYKDLSNVIEKIL